MAVFAGIEAGGTKFVCAVGTAPHDLRARVEFLTTSPEDTLGRVEAFLQMQVRRESLAGVGIASFGPIDANLNSPWFGHITSTPKAGCPCHFGFMFELRGGSCFQSLSKWVWVGSRCGETVRK